MLDYSFGCFKILKMRLCIFPVRTTQNRIIVQSGQSYRFGGNNGQLVVVSNFRACPCSFFYERSGNYWLVIYPGYFVRVFAVMSRNNYIPSRLGLNVCHFVLHVSFFFAVRFVCLLISISNSLIFYNDFFKKLPIKSLGGLCQDELRPFAGLQ